MKVVPIERKSRVLTRAQFGCLKGAFTLNVTRGCDFSCVYCYARGYPDAPTDDTIYLYSNLPERLQSELDNPRRRMTVDRVIFNTASDSFQAHPDILEITYQTMEILLERGISLSVLTKGWIPDRFIELFEKTPNRITARIGLVSINPRFRDVFEPGTATVEQRLSNIHRLRSIGIDVSVRIDPIIPFYTDDPDSIDSLFETLSQRQIFQVALSYLHLRPAILRQLEKELPVTAYQVLRTCFVTRRWTRVGEATRSKLVSQSLRQKGYQRFLERAKSFGIKPFICSCKNPDMPGHFCHPRADMCEEAKTTPSQKPHQISLFK